LYRGTTSYRVLDEREAANFPGLPLGARVGTEAPPFESFAMGNGFVIAVATTLTTTGNTPQKTVLLWQDGQWYELQGQGGGAATDLLSGVNDDAETLYLANDLPHLGSASGERDLTRGAPSALDGVEWENFGGAINNSGQAVVRFRRTSDDGVEFGLALWNGDRLEVLVDTGAGLPDTQLDTLFGTVKPDLANIDRVGTIVGRPETDRPGRSGALSDRGECVYRVGALGDDGKSNTADDYQAIYLFNAD
jgi:hypothetical protein